MNEKIEISKKGFKLGGKDFYLASGDIHYFRIYPTEWKRHLLLAKDFGLTTIQTYVPWNLHEPKKGQFCFDGMLDIEAYLRLADEMGLKVLLRPAPYICSECELGGLPSWLLEDENVSIRCSEPTYLKHLHDYYSVLIPKILPYLSTNGGPVLMVAIENEYGGSGYDKVYLKAIADMLIELGVDVPLYTTDNYPQALHMGSLPGILLGSNFRSSVGNGTTFADITERDFPNFPFFVGELWAGRAIYWGEPYRKRVPKDTSDSYAECLKRGFVNFYMFSGGTNFGFFSGALVDRSLTPRPGTPTRYIAHTTTYDEDALVSENGIPTEKYYLCREELDKFLGKPVRKDRTLPFDYKLQKLDIKLTESARLFDNIAALTKKTVKHPAVRTFEQCGQDFGFMMYSTEIGGFPYAGKCELVLDGIHDRATVYDGDTYIGESNRDRDGEKLYIDPTDRDVNLNILVENVARINGGKLIDRERKGITGYVTMAGAKLYHWTMRSLPMSDLSGISYVKNENTKDNDPTFFRGTFDAEAGVDTFLDMRSWGRGFVVINGFNIGKFWSIGPQLTLYIPGGLLKAKDNVIEIFDVNHVGAADSIRTIDEHLLEMD